MNQQMEMEVETQVLQQFNGLIISQVLKFKPRQSHDFDDLKQIASIGLIKAHRTWKENKAKFITYATTCIQNELLLNYKYQKRKCRKNISVDALANYGTPGYNNIVDILLSLTPEEQKITELRYSGYTLKQIGQYFGHCKNWANKRTQKIISKLKSNE